jgi:hypothetical protein
MGVDDQESTAATPVKGALGWISTANLVLTAVATMVATVAAIYSKVNDTHIAEVNQKVDNQTRVFDLAQKKEKATSEFAQTFRDLLQDPSLTEAEQKKKRFQAMLAVLNLTAQSPATNPQEETKAAHARALIPLQLALFMDQPGGVAAMDADYQFIEDWLGMAFADDSDKTRVTAIRALSGMCQKALRQGNLDVVAKCVEAIDQLFALIGEVNDATNDLRVPANAARLQLDSFIKKEDDLLSKATLTGGSKDEEAKVRKRVQEAFLKLKLVEKMQEAAVSLKKDKTEGAANSGSAAGADQQHATIVDQKLAEVNAALASAASAASPPPASSGSNSNQEMDKFISALQAPSGDIRRNAISQLALIGQPAVKPMLGEMWKRFRSRAGEDANVRVGIATAFKFMRQPVNLDDVDASGLVALLGAPEKEACDFTGDFLTNIFPEETLHNLFDALEAVVEPLIYPVSEKATKDQERQVYSAAFVVATWARFLDDTIQSPEKGTPMRLYCLNKARYWDSMLKATHSTGDDRAQKSDWRLTTGMLDRLLAKAGGVNPATAPPPPAATRSPSPPPTKPRRDRR